MNKIENPTEIRKMLLSRGYLPLPNLDKRCMLKGWPTVVPTEELISMSWSRMSRYKATGLRIGKPFGVIDSDISIEAINAAVIERWAVYLPDVFDNADVPLLERGTTASCKVAFFVRMEEPFGRLATHEFEDEHGKKHKVEIFGGTSPREFGAFGLHDITLGSTYVWKADSPLDVDAARLPALTKAQCKQLIEIAQETMRSMGLKQVERLSEDDDSRDILYDITDKMEFENGDSVYSLAELKEVLASTDSLRITAGWHDPASDNRDNPRCIARLIDGDLLITDFGEDGKKHMEAKPAEVSEEEIAEAMAKLEAMETKEEPISGPTAGDSFATVVAKLLMLYCYCPSMNTAVVDVLDPNHTMAQGNFFSAMAKFSEERRNQAGNIVTVNPGKVWLASKDCHTIRGMQMRPDMKTLFFRENGAEWLNTYRPPAHDAQGGSSALLWQLMEQIAPDAFERTWMIQNLAYKFLHPEIPGPAVIMLAQDQFGTGRGTFMALLVKLFGQHVAQLPAHLFTGSSYQAQYTEWLSDNVIVCIEEMVELKGGSKYAAKHDLYERLKELIEPRLKRRKIVRRGTKAIDEMVSCSVYAFLNNLDDIPIHERDRRCFVLRNGMPREASFWMAVNASIENPADVAAFARDLRLVDLAGYSPYDPPPVTEAKLDMADIAKSDLQRGVDAALAGIEGKSEIFSLLHVVNGMHAARVTDGLQYPDNWESMVGRIVGKMCFRVGVRDGQNWLPMFDGKRWPTYSRTAMLAVKWKTVEAGFVQVELSKAGTLRSTYGGQGPSGMPGYQD